MPARLERLWRDGWALHWLQGRSKVPHTGWNSRPDRHALDQLRRTWRPENNVSVRLGAPSTFVDGSCLAIIDIDVKGGTEQDWVEAWAVAREHFPAAVDDAPQLMTGRGAHLYVRLSRAQAATCKELIKETSRKVPVMMDGTMQSRSAWQVSLYANGRHALIVGSIHPDTGTEYAWQRPYEGWESVPFVELPETALRGADAAASRPGPGKGPLPIEDADVTTLGLRADQVAMIVDGDGAPPGTRSEALLSLTLALLRRGVAEPVIRGVFTNSAYALGQVGYERRKTRSRQNAARWFEGTLRKAARYIEADAAVVFDVEPGQLAGALAAPAGKRRSPPAVKPLKQGKKAPAAGRSSPGGSADVGDDEAAAADDAEEPPPRKALLPYGFSKIAGWMANLDMKYDKENLLPPLIKPTFGNLRLIMQNLADDPNFLAIDEFAIKAVYLADTPWGGKRGEARSADEADALRVKTWLSDVYRIQPAISVIEEALGSIAIANSFHPVRQYLEGLSWDGVERIGTAFETYLGARAPQPYLGEVSRKFFAACVQRVFEPGCKSDHAPVIEGPTGIGKSSFVRILAGKDWYIDKLPNLADKDSALYLSGVWLCELGEMANTLRAAEEEVKSFISREVDKVRPPYGRRRIDYPRSTTFVGTTEKSVYLTAETNRRWWPLPCRKRLDFARLEAERDQLWAEAVFAYQFEREQLWLEVGGKALAQATMMQELRRVEDQGDRMRGPLEVWLRDNPTVEQVTIAELWADVLSNFPFNIPTSMRAGDILKKLGFIKRHTMHGNVWVRTKTP